MAMKNKTVLITGASSGIGAASAEIFAKNNAKLLLCGRRIERIEKLAAHLSKTYHIEVYPFSLDVRSTKEIAKKLSSLPTAWQDIDILINNAGLAAGLDKSHEANLEDWEAMIDTNIKGLLYLTHFVLKNMVPRNAGHIINIGSIAGHDVYAGGSVYCATKHAVFALTKGLKMDLLGTNIRVTSVDPGMVDTEFSLVRFKGNSERAKKVYSGMNPLTANDVADAVYYCATRPQHVNVLDIILLPQDQAAANIVHRKA